jgi:hypothetical protein
LNPYWRIAAYAGASALLFLGGWHARVVWDEARTAKALQAEIQARAEAERAMNQGAAEYEKSKQVLENQIYVLKQNLSKSRRMDPAPCRVPADVLRAVRDAASGGVPR